MIASRRGPALSREVRADVNPASMTFTDDWQAYKPLRREFLLHQVINHSEGVYVRGYVHTNTILRQPQDRDAWRLQEGVAALPAVDLNTSTPSVTTHAAKVERRSFSYLLGRRAAEPFAARLTSLSNVERFGTGISTGS